MLREAFGDKWDSYCAPFDQAWMGLGMPGPMDAWPDVQRLASAMAMIATSLKAALDTMSGARQPLANAERMVQCVERKMKQLSG